MNCNEAETLGTATYRRLCDMNRHFCHASDSAAERFAAVVVHSSRRLTG